jgi:hypothetical protein
MSIIANMKKFMFIAKLNMSRNYFDLNLKESVISSKTDKRSITTWINCYLRPEGITT